MIEKIKSIVSKILYFFSKDSCHDEMIERGWATETTCPGLAGGDRHSDYLACSCMDCKYWQTENRLKELT